MKLSANKYTMAVDPALPIYAVFGVLSFVGGITLLIFAGSYISKSGKCKSFQKKRHATVSNQVKLIIIPSRVPVLSFMHLKIINLPTINIEVLSTIATKECKKCAYPTCNCTVNSLFQHWRWNTPYIDSYPSSVNWQLLIKNISM